MLGSGTFGDVVHVKDNYGRSFAAKEINIKIKKKRESALREFEVLSRLSHEKVVKLYGAFQQDDRFILLTE